MIIGNKRRKFKWTDYQLDKLNQLKKDVMNYLENKE